MRPRAWLGDRCLAFHYSDGQIEEALSSLGRARAPRFGRPHLPPLPGLLPLGARAEALAGAPCPDAEAAGELALELLEAAFRLLDDIPAPPAPDDRDRRRVAAALHRIEHDHAGALGLADLAAEAHVSPFHFLRIFRSEVGLTPYRYLLRTRLHRAAVELRQSGRPVSEIAFDAGFGDLSTFNRRFRHAFGSSPGDWRRRR